MSALCRYASIYIEALTGSSYKYLHTGTGVATSDCFVPVVEHAARARAEVASSGGALALVYNSNQCPKMPDVWVSISLKGASNSHINEPVGINNCRNNGIFIYRYNSPM